MNKDDVCGICTICQTGVDGEGICDCNRVKSICPTCGTKLYDEVRFVYGNACETTLQHNYYRRYNNDYA